MSGRTGEALTEKTWPLDKKLIMDWRMPTDATRVILFERIGYEIEMNKIEEEDSKTSQLAQELVNQIK